MSENYPQWISPTMIKGVRGFNLDAYLVALEGWRRGLALKWYLKPEEVTPMKIIGFYPLGKTFSLSSEDKTHFFYRSRCEVVANSAVELTANKDQTKTYLTEAGVPHPEGQRFNDEAKNEEIIDYAVKLGFPLVLKPTFGSLGKGVVTNIQSEVEFKDSLSYVRTELGFKDVIVERFLQGDDYRVYVIGDQVIAATKRVPAHVIGDGKSTIEQLIFEKNKLRKENPYLATKLIKIEQDLITFIEKYNYNLRSVPEKDQVVYLKGQSNIAAGGDPIDATDDIPTEAKNIAIQAVQAIPGLIQAGVDVLIHNDRYNVIEINATAEISLHLFPTKGKSRHVPARIIDYYFSETVGMTNGRNKIYFDYTTIRRLLKDRLINDIALPDAPKGKIYAKRYVISGKVQKVGYRNWVRGQATKRQLDGYTRNLNNGKVVVVVAHENEKLVDDFKDVCYQGSKRSVVEHVEEYVWNGSIKLGFEIRRTRQPSRKKLEEKITNLQMKNKRLTVDNNKQQKETEKLKLDLSKANELQVKTEQERLKAEKEYENIKNSRIWRYTTPLRKVGKRVKKLVKK